MSRQKSSPRFRFNGAAILLPALAFLVPALREGDQNLYVLSAAIPAAMLVCTTILARIFSLDKIVLSLSVFLCTIGIVSFSDDPNAAVSQCLYCLAGIAFLLLGSVLVRSLKASVLIALCTGFPAILLLAGRLMSSSVPEALMEVSLVLLLVSCASFLSLGSPWPALFTGLIGFALLLACAETQLAVLWGLIMLALLWTSDGRLLILSAASVLILLLFLGTDLLLTVSLVPSPDQSTLSFSAFIDAGWIGADHVPEGLLSSDAVSLFPRLAIRYGLLFSGLSVMLFLPLFLRGMSVAGVSRSKYSALLAMGSSLLVALKALMALLSFFGFLPFADCSFPLLTSSVTALFTPSFLLGMVCGISGRNDADLAEDSHLAMLAK